MCSRARCRKCGKVGWSGCGAHVDAVMRGIPEDERCKCREAPKVKPAGGWSRWLRGGR